MVKKNFKFLTKLKVCGFVEKQRMLTVNFSVFVETEITLESKSNAFLFVLNILNYFQN